MKLNFTLAIILFSTLFVSCGTDEGWPADGDYPITFGSDTILTLYAEAAVADPFYADSLDWASQIEIVDYLDSDPPIFYSSDNEFVATVSETGYIQALHTGTANITVKNAFEEHIVEITVAPTQPDIDSIPTVDFSWDRLAIMENFGSAYESYSNDEGYKAMVYPNFTNIDVFTAGDGAYHDGSFSLCFVFASNNSMVYYGFTNESYTTASEIPTAVFEQQYALVQDSLDYTLDSNHYAQAQYLDEDSEDATTMNLYYQTVDTPLSQRTMSVWYTEEAYTGQFYTNWE